MLNHLMIGEKGFASLLELIESKKEKFSNLAFFEFLKNENIEPDKRLAFAPKFAFFVMSFADLNKYILRDISLDDEIQDLVNEHTHEEDRHWIWYLEDLRKLGYNTSNKFTDTLSFLWGKELEVQRTITYKILGYASQSSPLEKLIIIETIEAIANIFESATYQVAQSLEAITKINYQYFGHVHLKADSNHSILSHDLSNLDIDISQFDKYCDVINKIFGLFTELMNDLQKHAENSGSINVLKN